MIHRVLFVPVLALAITLLLCALIAASPLSQAAPQSVDSDYFEDGGLLLLETFRLHRQSFLDAAKLTVLSFLLCQTLILVARAALYRAALACAMTPSPLRSPRGLGRALPSFLALSLLRSCAVFAVVWALSVVAKHTVGALYARAGVSGALWFAACVVSGLGLLALATVGVFFDCSRLQVFLPRHSKRRATLGSRVRQVFVVLIRHPSELVGWRCLVLVATGVHAATTSLLLRDDVPVALTWMGTITLPLLVVLVESFYLVRASRALVSTPLEVP